MEFLVIAYSFLAFILVVLLASPAGQRMDKKRSRIDRINNSVGQPIFKELELPFYERILGKGITFPPNSASSFLKRKVPVKQRHLKLSANSFVMPAYLWKLPIFSL